MAPANLLRYLAVLGRGPAQTMLAELGCLALVAALVLLLAVACPYVLGGLARVDPFRPRAVLELIVTEAVLRLPV